MAEQYNPFAGLAPVTPEGLNAVREARFEHQSKGQSFWAQEAGRAGLNARRNLLAQGVALSPDDERALSSQAIMQGAQKRLSGLVKSGELDPMSAQELVINETMSAFMQAGDYEAAQSLLPALNQIRTYKDEQAKLKSETYKNLSAGDASHAQAAKDYTSAATDAAESPSVIAKNEGAAVSSEAQARMYDATARLRDRTDPNIRSQPKGASNFKQGQSAIDETLAAQSGTMTLFGYLNDLSSIMTESPRSASAAGAAANTAGQYVSGTWNFLNQKGAVAPVSPKDLDPAGQAIVSKALAANRVAMAKQAASLGMDVTRYQSLVIETAYALARVNDPGGRLSNNDFDFALRQLGAVQDARSAKAAFYAIAQRAKKKIDDKMAVLPPDYVEQQYATGNKAIEEAWANFDQTWSNKPAPFSRAPSGAKADKDGWTTLPNGTRIREKK